MNTTATDKIKIVCLPVAGNENPYQQLMIAGLNQNKKLNAFNGINDRFLGIIRSGIKYRPDYMHFDWIESYYTRRYAWLTYIDIPVFMFQVLFVRYILRIRFIWTLHNLFPHTTYQRKLHIRVQRWFAKHVAAIRLFNEHSLTAAMQILNQPDQKFQICPEGSYIDYYPNTITKEEARKYLNIAPDKKVFLFFGTFSPYKGVLELMQDFNLNNALLICAGKMTDAAYFEKLKSALKDKIQMHLQFIPVDKVQYFFNAADLVVLPFREIENSGSLVLAMGFKKPVLAPASNVINDRLQQQEDLLYSPGGLKNKLEYAFQLSSSLLEKYGAANLNKVKSMNWADFSRVFLNKQA